MLATALLGLVQVLAALADDAGAPHFQRLTGGLSAASDGFQYQVLIRQQLDGKPLCGGAVVSRTHFVTAARCFYGQIGDLIDTSYLEVVVGMTDKEDTWYLQKVAIVGFEVPADFDAATFANDVAIVKVSPKFLLTPRVALIQVFPFEIYNETNCVVSGWGEVDQLNHPDRLQRASLDLVDPKRCEDLQGEFRRQRHLCAEQRVGRANLCYGDAGNPLVCHDFLVGLASFDFRTCVRLNSTGAFVKLSAYGDWIRNATKEATLDPPGDGAAACLPGLAIALLLLLFPAFSWARA